MSKYQNEVLNFYNQNFLLRHSYKTIICSNNLSFWIAAYYLPSCISIS